MCGIVGKVNSRNARPIDRELIASMCRALAHRGPDAQGMLVEGEVGLGIQRLRVIDLVTGDQPVYNEDRTVAVVLNGEIYNYRELADGLRRRGHTLATHGDTEVIAHMYEEYGVDCVGHLHGMFAFAVWDRRRRTLMLARDRVGKKPLFYSLRNGSLSFASELRALMEDGEIPRRIDSRAVDSFLTYGYVPSPISIFEAVRKLPPAHTLLLRGGEAEVRRYWRLDYSRKVSVDDPRELHEPLRDMIRAATRRRLVADVPVGAFLSGGVDSSAVVAAMAEASRDPVKTFSIGFEHDAFDELPYARQVAERFGTEHHELTVRADDIGIVPRMVRQYGEPFADASAIPCFYLSELTRRHVTVALNGDGGDESFGGYTRYVANRVAGRLDQLPHALRRLIGTRAEGVGGGDPASLPNKIRRLRRALPLSPEDRYRQYVAWFPDGDRRRQYTDEFSALLETPFTAAVVDAPWGNASGDDVLDVMLEVDASTYLPGDLIPKIDIATMAYALEARSPLLDHELMEFAASIPAAFKVRGRQKKWILREALREWLPDEILDRPKQGFTPPVSRWFRGELREHLREVLLDRGCLDRGYFRPDAIRQLLDRHERGADGVAKQLWALYVLELWHREFVDPRSNAYERVAPGVISGDAPPSMFVR